MAFQSKDSLVLDNQLKVQKVVVKLADKHMVSVSGSTATIDVKETIKEVRMALFMDDSAGTIAPVAAASQSISGTAVTLTLSAALAAADAIELQYVIDEA